MADRSTTVRMSLSVSNKLKEFVRKTKGKDFRLGDYMETLDKAAMEYITNRNKNTTTQYTTSTQRITKQEVVEVKNKIIEWMLTPGSNPNRANTSLFEGEGEPKYIVEKHLKEAIKIVTGKVDKRTVDNWIKRLEVCECIKNRGARQFEFLTDSVDEVVNQKEDKQLLPISISP
jgi:hypothetical protein